MDYKAIRNKITSFSYESMVALLFEVLKRQEADLSGPSPFWHPLLLLRWSMEFAGQKYPSKPATKQDLAKLFKQLEELEMAHATFDLKKNGRLSKTFTILSFQQFQYQEKPWFDTFQRQYILYCKLNGSHDINGSFLERTGVTIADLLCALKILWMAILHSALPGYEYRGVLTNDHLFMISDLIGQEQMKRIVELFSISKESIKAIVKEDPRLIKDYNLQVFEPSIFTVRPFFEYEQKLLLPHREILNHTINHFIYDFMKNRDDRFSEDLGKRLEKYIELGLRENDMSFLSESKLKQLLGRERKVVDFLIEGDILLECKAIELRPYANINPTDDILLSEMAKSITKAYAMQMMETIQQLNEEKEYFGIIVTYKKLNLGETEDIWEQFLRSETEKIVQDPKERNKLPYRNLFFIDLASWDIVMQIAKTNKLALKSILMNTQLAKERKFGFYMHLDEYKVKNFDLRYLHTDIKLLDS